MFSLPVTSLLRVKWFIMIYPLFKVISKLTFYFGVALDSVSLLFSVVEGYDLQRE